jgi:hypothetical protein
MFMLFQLPPRSARLSIDGGSDFTASLRLFSIPSCVLLPTRGTLMVERPFFSKARIDSHAW